MVYKVHKEAGHYTIMSNHHLLNRSLSNSARGLLSLILALPPSVECTQKALLAYTTDGPTAIKSAVEELKKAGYIMITKTRKNGRFCVETHVFETPEMLADFQAQNIGNQLNKAPSRKNRHGSTVTVPPSRKNRDGKTDFHNNNYNDSIIISTHTKIENFEKNDFEKNEKNETVLNFEKVKNGDEEKINQIFRGAEFSAAAARAYGAAAAEMPIFAAIFGAWAIKKGLEYESEAHLKNIAQDALKWVVPAARKSQTRKTTPAAPPPASREAIKKDKEAQEAARAAGKRFKL